MKTALDARHRALGARMIPFAGWDMPVQYRGLVEEHNAVRTAAGLFDLSHMGEIYVTGPDAAAALDYALVTAPGKLAVGRAHYSMICDESGGVLDDLIVYRLGETRYMVVPNASNAATVATALGERLKGFDAALDDASMRTSLVAIQGPLAAEILQPFVDVDLATINLCCRTDEDGTTTFAYGAVSPKPLLVADTSGILADPAASAHAKSAALDALLAQAAPITDVRASKEYRLAMLRVLSRRTLHRATEALATRRRNG
jgi:hypothetical protein